MTILPFTPYLRSVRPWTPEPRCIESRPFRFPLRQTTARQKRSADAAASSPGIQPAQNQQMPNFGSEIRPDRGNVSNKLGQALQLPLNQRGRAQSARTKATL